MIRDEDKEKRRRKNELKVKEKFIKVTINRDKAIQKLIKVTQPQQDNDQQRHVNGQQRHENGQQRHENGHERRQMNLKEGQPRGHTVTVILEKFKIYFFLPLREYSFPTSDCQIQIIGIQSFLQNKAWDINFVAF